MTNDRIADALAGATVETLREDAAFCARMAMDRDSDTFRRLAALALAVADLEENGRSVMFGVNRTQRVVLIDEDGMDFAAKGKTLPDALASLLRPEGA